VVRSVSCSCLFSSRDALCVFAFVGVPPLDTCHHSLTSSPSSPGYFPYFAQFTSSHFSIFRACFTCLRLPRFQWLRSIPSLAFPCSQHATASHVFVTSLPAHFDFVYPCPVFHVLLSLPPGHAKSRAVVPDLAFYPLSFFHFIDHGLRGTATKRYADTLEIDFMKGSETNGAGE
jgi:hypothetical protein